MMLSYFLTGSLHDHDNDFELTIRQSGSDAGSPQYILRLEDLTSAEKLCWESLRTGFADALSALSDFTAGKRIRFYGKNATSSPIDPLIDRQLQEFIYSTVPRHL